MGIRPITQFSSQECLLLIWNFTTLTNEWCSYAWPTNITLSALTIKPSKRVSEYNYYRRRWAAIAHHSRLHLIPTCERNVFLYSTVNAQATRRYVTTHTPPARPTAAYIDQRLQLCFLLIHTHPDQQSLAPVSVCETNMNMYVAR